MTISLLAAKQSNKIAWVLAYLLRTAQILVTTAALRWNRQV